MELESVILAEGDNKLTVQKSGAMIMLGPAHLEGLSVPSDADDAQIWEFCLGCVEKLHTMAGALDAAEFGPPQLSAAEVWRFIGPMFRE